jgi:hypothetical protein
MPSGNFLRSSSGNSVDPVSIEAPSGGFAPKRNANQSLTARLASPIAFLAIGAILFTLFVGILRINNGTFLYTLDDPYIHLALSDQIRHGNYGLYPGTHAAPSSSILFPFLLAIVSGTPLHPYFPLLINICALFFTAEVMRRFLLHLRLGTDDFAIAAQAAAVFIVALSLNLIGVVFTGLEHSLHIATVAAIVYGLALFLDRDKMPSWLPVAIVLCPLVRYEGMALSSGALLVLALRGRFRTALATFAVIFVLLGGFSVFLIKLGLPPLPSSVLVKSGVAAGGVDHGLRAFLAGMAKNADFMVTQPAGIVLLLIGVLAATMCVLELIHRRKPWSSRGLMALALLSLIGGQAAAGRWGWLSRYEDYLLLGTAMISIYLAQAAIREALARPLGERVVLAAGLATALLVFGAPYCQMTRNVPLASNNIYEQQLQMHSFVDKFYKGPIAINDLGLSSYHNPYPVLDLGGLGSEKARKLIAANATAADYEAFVAANDVHLVMVYEEWFPGQIPETWQRVGMMSLSRAHLSAAYDDVQFYVTDNVTAARVREELAEFEKTLPPRIELTIY